MNDVLLNRRRAMMQVGDNLPKYIENGLTLWLDANDFDGTVWIDKIQGVVFTNHGAVKDGDKILFDGDSYMDAPSPFPSTGAVNSTSEACFLDETGGQIICQGIGARKIGYVKAITPYGYSATNNGNGWWYKYAASLNNVHTISIDQSTGFVDGVQVSPVNSYGNYSALAGIGKERFGTYYKGYIHSIRLYNRDLTDDEKRWNAYVDDVRFNLGLGLVPPVL